MIPQDHSAFGRKVFFLFPPYDFSKIILEKLFDMEFEMYILENLSYTKNLMRKFPGSILFINIDAYMPVEAWLNYTASFAQDTSLSDTLIGIFTHASRKSDKDMFLLQGNISAGYISTAMEYEDLAEVFKGVLDINNAKGRRKYVRADCLQAPNISAQCTVAGTVYKLIIQNISSVGMACLMPAQYASVFPENTLVRDILITLDDHVIRCSAAVIISKLENNILTVVFLFMKGTSHSTRAIVRAFIRQYLFKKALISIEDMLPDTTDYRKKEAPAEDDKNKKIDYGAFLVEINDNDQIAPDYPSK